MPSLSVPPHLIQYIGSAQISHWQAAEALEEWIWQRRNKGDTLFEVSVGLLDLEDRVPQRTPAFDRARINTNVPHPAQLTPPDAESSRASASPVTILHHLLSSASTIERSREVILEYTLSREIKLREKKPGRGGKGTLDKEGLEDIGERLAEVEAGLTNAVDLALILSLRMSLSYFTLPALARQLLVLSTPDAERVLVQHIRRRVEGTGRYGVGMELESLEALTTNRPALRPTFRSARAKTSLPEVPISVPFPAPSKSACIKLIEPATARELVTEYLTRERREYMMKCKWAVKGRDALGKDLGDVESATCLHKGEATPQAQHLLPIFLELRRTFLLPPSPLPLAIVAPYYDILPASPDPDEEYREPSISNTTASLYVNPRLENEAAARILEELVEAEREKAVAEGANEEEVAELLDELVKHVEKRFPDGSYAEVFARARNVRTVAPVSLESPPPRQNSLHTRALSSGLNVPPRRGSHTRSISLPDEAKPTLPAIITDQPFSAFLGPEAAERNSGWWDVVSAVGSDSRSPFRSSCSPDRRAPWRTSLGASPERIPERSRRTSGAEEPQMLWSSPTSEAAPLPPGAASPIRTSFAQMSLENHSPETRPPPVPLVFDRPSFPSTDKSPTPSARSKLATFGRSMSMARRKKDDGKENKRKDERWNRDMVASIMGQPADRR